jgi:hypothetical protein
MKDDVSFSVTCPYCGRRIHRRKEVVFQDYLGDWDKLLSEFDMEEFHCQCGETFLGAETAQSEKIARVVEMAKNLELEGKVDISENGVKIKLGFSDIWRIIRELKNLKGDVV